MKSDVLPIETVLATSFARYDSTSSVGFPQFLQRELRTAGYEIVPTALANRIVNELDGGRTGADEKRDLREILAYKFGEDVDAGDD